jgi:hypothetical protein
MACANFQVASGGVHRLSIDELTYSIGRVNEWIINGNDLNIVKLDAIIMDVC